MSGALTQPVDVPAVVRHAFHLVLPKGATLTKSSRLFANWIEAAFSGNGRPTADGTAAPTIDIEALCLTSPPIAAAVSRMAAAVAKGWARVASWDRMDAP